MPNVKAHLVLISIIAFVVISMSSCFLKPQHHFNDHRGVYKDKGMTKGQLAYLEERKRRQHPGRYAKKKHVKSHYLKEDHRAKKSSEQNTVAPKDTAALLTPVQAIDTTVQVPPTPQPGAELQHSTDQPTDPGKTNRKEKKKHKKNKQGGA